MTYKPVGVDESSLFPPRVETRLTEKVQDILGAALVAGANISSITYDDTAGTVTINAATQSGGGGGGSVAWADITGKPSTFAPDVEALDDRVAALLTAGSNVTLTYNDAAGTLTIASSGGGGGTIQDTGWRNMLAPLIAEGYSDAGDTQFRIRRIANRVDVVLHATANAGGSWYVPVPAGWEPSLRQGFPIIALDYYADLRGALEVRETRFVAPRLASSGTGYCSASWITDTTFPSAGNYPGTAV